MNSLKIVLIMILIITSIAAAQDDYPYRNIRDIQSNSLDSLLLADQLQNTIGTRWKLQGANSTTWRYVKIPPSISESWCGDTVKIVGVCVVPPKVFTYTAFGYNMVLADTNYDGSFGHIFIRANISTTSNPTDTVYYSNMLAVQEGDIVEVIGFITEFPTNSMNSMTQIVPLKDPNFSIIGQSEIPTIQSTSVSGFYVGLEPSSYPGGVKYSTGEALEAKYVELTDLTVTSILSTGYGVKLVDDYGNNISTYDASRWFTTRPHKDPTSTYSHPPVFSRIDTIRGWVTPVSGQENNYGYRIAPVYPGDIVIGISRPSITRVYRYPVIVTTDSGARVEATIKKLPLGANIKDRLFIYSINNEDFIIDTLQMVSGDTLYSFTIPPQPIGTNVKYFVKAVDVNGYYTISANGAFGGFGTDTSKGFYFYKVNDGNLTIRDVQYTPYLNGRSPYVGAVTTIRGIVTADTNDVGLSPKSSGGVSTWYLQSGNGPFSGIWFTGLLDTLKSLQKGDSVAITGSIQEDYDVTRIGNVTSMEIFSSGNPLPEAVKLTTGIFGPGAGNGNLLAEPWEGMLVEFDTVEVKNLNPVYNVFTEYAVNDGTGEILVRRDGRNTYSNVEADTIYPGTVIMQLGDKFAGFTGILHYSYNRYKICPRTNSDFGTYISVGVSDEIPGQLPLAYELANNYPNPFNPKTVIEYALPQTEMVSIKVFNVLGQEVAKLKNEVQRAGRYRVSFDASNLATGLYFYRLQTPNFVQVKKMILVK